MLFPTEKSRFNHRFVSQVIIPIKNLGILLTLLVFCLGATVLLAQPEATVESESQLTALKNKELALAQRLTEAFPQSEDPLVIMGNIHSRHGNTDQALVFWNQATQKNSKCVDAYHKMAELAFQMDRFEEAIVSWRKILEIDPKIRGAHVKIAEALMNLGDYEQCIVEARKEVETTGHASVETALLLGRAHQHLQDYAQAREYYEQVIAQSPDHMNAYYGLYNVCARLKDRQEAQQYMKKYRDLKAQQKEVMRHEDENLPSDVDCFYQSLAKFCFDSRMFYLKTQKDAGVEPMLKEGMALGMSSPAFLKRLAELYTAVQGDREALALYMRLAKLTPDDTTCYVKIGVLSVQLGLLDMAERAFGEVVTREPDSYIGFQELSRLYLRMQKNIPQSRIMAQKAVALKPSAPGYYDLALACAANQDLTGAVRAMEKAVEMDPHNARFAQALALFKQKEGDTP